LRLAAHQRYCISAGLHALAVFLIAAEISLRDLLYGCGTEYGVRENPDV
jgi:hypothetical protein